VRWTQEPHKPEHEQDSDRNIHQQSRHAQKQFPDPECDAQVKDEHTIIEADAEEKPGSDGAVGG
jgi:hypothetical protein